MKKQAFNARLCAYLDASPTPFHATANARGRLLDAGFVALDERDAWQLEPGGRYVVTRNDSSLIAFRLGSQPLAEDGLRMVGAHTDSPCLKLKPNPVLSDSGYTRLGVEVYGGVLLNPWFDRDLSLAGRVTCRNRGGRLSSTLIDFERPIAVVPSLAIHLDREANEKRKIDKQTMLPPVLGLGDGKPLDLPALIKRQLRDTGNPLAGDKLLDFELSFYDTQHSAVVGVGEEFICGARLDNLLSCHVGLEALIAAPEGHGQLLVLNDHEEVGSGSTSGARGNFLASVLERIAGDDEAYARMIARSMLVSTDNAHALHPNFAEKHDRNHGPLVNAGPVVKINANQAYATNSESSALLRHAAAKAKVELQSFVTRTDMACGSTIGPLSATVLGVRTVDVGVPTFAMHSIRELAGVDDAASLARVLEVFFGLASLDVCLAPTS